MNNRKRILTDQTSLQESESDSIGNRILKTWRKNKNRPSCKQRPQIDAPVRDGAGSMEINNWFPSLFSHLCRVFSRVLRAPKL